jgi:hypothetical protein
VFAAWLAVPVYGSLRTLTLCSRVRAEDCSAPSLEFRTTHRLLCVRYLTFRPARGLLRVPSSTPCVARGSLRAQHLEFPVYLGSLRLRLSLRPVPGLLLVRHLALCSTYGLLRTFHSCPVLIADCSALSTYCSALGPSGIPYSTPQVKLFRFIEIWCFHSCALSIRIETPRMGTNCLNRSVISNVVRTPVHPAHEP